SVGFEEVDRKSFDFDIKLSPDLRTHLFQLFVRPRHHNEIISGGGKQFTELKTKSAGSASDKCISLIFHDYMICIPHIAQKDDASKQHLISFCGSLLLSVCLYDAVPDSRRTFILRFDSAIRN